MPSTKWRSKFAVEGNGAGALAIGRPGRSCSRRTDRLIGAVQVLWGIRPGNGKLTYFRSAAGGACVMRPFTREPEGPLANYRQQEGR
jgi:hypothetical protein